MTTAAAKTVFTPDDLLRMSDAVNYELVDGSLVERQMGAESSAIAGAILSLLLVFVKSKRAGHVFTSECSYQCFADDPNKLRRADVSFIRMGRLPDEQVPKGQVRIAPDLAVEVLSPGDLAYEVEEKVAEYLAAGVKLVWVVSPNTRSVRIHRARDAKQGAVSALSESDRISGEEVLPGFECAVAEFFQI
jgi:Uma2 family endonuclease